MDIGIVMWTHIRDEALSINELRAHNSCMDNNAYPDLRGLTNNCSALKNALLCVT
jgi:hypothetical protein